MRLDLPGGPSDLEELGRLLPCAMGLIYVLLDHLLTALCGMDLIDLIRNIRGWGEGNIIISAEKLVPFGNCAQSKKQSSFNGFWSLRLTLFLQSTSKMSVKNK